MQSRYTSWRTERKWAGSLPCPVGARMASGLVRARRASEARQQLERFTTVAKQRSRPTRRRDRKTGGGGGRRKSCQYCRDKVEFVDYKDINALRKFVSDRGKIRSRRITGACRRHQNQIATAVKRARELALLPYVGEGGGRDEDGEGGRGGRGRGRGRD